MAHSQQSAKIHGERGAALLIAIFALLLISVVAISLIIASGTDSALARNYRGSSGAYYAALAGLEEGRGRLLWRNPAFINNTLANFVPPTGSTLDVHQVLYIINPVGGITIVPTDSSNTYADTEYDSEFPNWSLAGATVQPLLAASSLTAGVPNPPYAWVRITPVTEWSMGDIDVDGLNAHDKVTPLFFDGSGLNRTHSGSQALEVTTLAVLPNGTRKMLQYVTVPVTLNLSFPAALTLDGATPQFAASTSPNFSVKGNDYGSIGGCSAGPTPVAAVGYTSGAQSNFVAPTNPSGVAVGLVGQYSNGVAPDPKISLVTLSPNLQTVGGLNALVQTIEQNADTIVNYNATPADLPSGMSPTHPMTIAINGDLTLNGWGSTGYGLLLVTGKLTYDTAASWNGIILVIGKGSMDSSQTGSNTQIQGAVLLARTLDAAGMPMTPSSVPAFTATSGFDFSAIANPTTNAIQYSSCYAGFAQQPLTYKVLSFREIPQAN